MTDGDRSNPNPELLHSCLQRVTELGASDLHVRPYEPPFMRLNGHLVPIEGARELGPSDLDEMVNVLTQRTPTRRDEFMQNGEADLSYELKDVARFRVNIFRERGNTALTLRVIPQDVPRLEDLKLPEIISELATSSHGLVLVTGATGSGKTTTLAAMIDHMNRSTKKHILTIEDPIEIVHPNHTSLVSQREVGSDTGDFQQALRRALRQDPDVILIGEIRDHETMQTALAAAETGHLVLATLHTINAAETIARILDLFPAAFEKQARAMLAGALKGIVSQRLTRTLDGGRRAVVEVMINTGRIGDCILKPEETMKIPEAIEQGAFYGMQSFDQALIALILEGVISEDEAIHHVSAPQNFKLVLDSQRSQVQADADRQAAEAAALQAEIEAAEAAAAAEQFRLMNPPPGIPSQSPPGTPVEYQQQPPLQPPMQAPVMVPDYPPVPNMGAAPVIMDPNLGNPNDAVLVPTATYANTAANNMQPPAQAQPDQYVYQNGMPPLAAGELPPIAAPQQPPPQYPPQQPPPY